MTASRSRPMEKRRALACFHTLLHKVGGVPEDKLRLYGLSSLRKFLPNVGRANKLDNEVIPICFFGNFFSLGKTSGEQAVSSTD